MTKPMGSGLALSELGASIFRPGGLLLPIRQVFSTGIFVLVLNLGTGLITARLLGPHGRGELTAMVIWPGITVGLLTLGLPRAITYNLARGSNDASCLVLVGLLTSLCIGLVAAGLGALFVPLWLQEYPARTVEFAQWAMLAAPAGILMLSVNGVLQARSEFPAYNRNHYLPPLLALVALAGLGLFGTLTPYTAALAMIGSSLPILIVNLIRIAASCRSGCSEPVRSLRQLLSYGMRTYGQDAIARLSSQIDRVILIGLVSPAAVGLYVVAGSLAQPAHMLPNAIATVLFPEASRKGTTEAVALLARACWVSTVITCIVALGLAAVAPPLLELLYGEAFAPAVGPFRFLLIAVTLSGITQILMQAFLSSGRPGIVSGLFLLGLLATVTGMLLLVPVYGIAGAGLALLISNVVRLTCTLLCFPLVLKVQLLTLLPQRHDLRRASWPMDFHPSGERELASTRCTAQRSKW